MSSQTPKFAGVIPARWGSTRFLGKPLAKINGKPLLQWVIEGSRASKRIGELFVATDDQRIESVARECGVKSIMTPSDLPTGTDRIWAAAQAIEADVLINIQGDEPLISGAVLDRLCEPFLTDTNLEMATLARELTHDDLHSVSTAKIVVNHKSEALYFSRFAIPYSRENAVPPRGQPIRGSLKHIGIYAYRREFLKRFCEHPPSAAELAESLEQLRALDLGAKIKVVQVEHDSWGVDTPEDVQKIERIMNSRAQEGRS